MHKINYSLPAPSPHKTVLLSFFCVLKYAALILWQDQETNQLTNKQSNQPTNKVSE